MKLLQRFRNHTDRIFSAAISPEAKWIVSCSVDGTAIIYQRQGEIYRQHQFLPMYSFVPDDVETKKASVRQAYFANETNLVLACFDKITRYYVFEDDLWQLSENLDDHMNEVKCASMSSDCLSIASCSRDKVVYVYYRYDDHFEVCADLRGHTQDIKYVSFSPNDLFIASASYDNSVRIWHIDEDEWSPYHSFASLINPAEYSTKTNPDYHVNTVWCVKWLDTRRVMSCSADGTIKIFNVETKTCEKSFDYGLGEIYSFTVHNNQIYFTNGLDVVISDFEGNVIEKVRAHNGDVNSVASAGDILVTASDDGFMKVWNL